MPGEKRRNWREADARRALAEMERRKESLLAFERRTGVPGSRLSWWRKRLSDSDGASPAPLELLPVRVRDTAASSQPGERPAAFEIVIGTHVVRVPAEFDDEALVRLVAALKQTPC